MKCSKKCYKAALILFLAAFSWFQPAAQSVVKLVSDTTCRPDTIQISLVGGQIPDVYSFELIFSFDPTKLRFDSIFYSMSFLDGFVVSELVNPSTLRLTWDSVIPLRIVSERPMFRLQFSAIGEGISPLSWDLSSKLLDIDGLPVATGFFDGQVLINSKAIQYTLTQILEGCRKEEKGRYAISVTSGSPPYRYDWHGGFLNPGVDTVVLGLAGGQHPLTIFDQKGCRHDTTYSVKVKPSPKIRMYTEPANTYVILQKPDIQFYSNIDSINFADNSISNWQWSFGEPDSSRSVETNPRHTFTTAFSVLEKGGTSYTVRLWAINTDGCDSTVYKEIEIERPKPKVYNVITPNGDMKNELFVVRGSENPDLEDWVLNDFYDRTELLVYDRNGRKVYESADYQNDWDGGGHAAGTYFYVLKCYGRFGEETYQGSMMILRGE